jgi:hypothetical protein
MFTVTRVPKVAVHTVLPVTVTVVTGLVPEQAPPQPAKVDAGEAVSCTLPVKGALQVDPQLMPAGTDTTSPVSVPRGLMVRVPPRANVAMQLRLEVVTVTVVLRAVPEQSALHPVKLDPESATAVSWTEPLNGALWIGQVVPQLMLAGDEVTVPVPFPPF